MCAHAIPQETHILGSPMIMDIKKRSKLLNSMTGFSEEFSEEFLCNHISVLYLQNRRILHLHSTAFQVYWGLQGLGQNSSCISDFTVHVA